LTWQYLGALLTGAIIGFLGGLFGKGGSAVATPLLSLLGFPGFVAVASPLPATVPSTVVASAEYWRSRLLDWEIVWWSIGIGTPAIVAGSFLSRRPTRADLRSAHRCVDSEVTGGSVFSRALHYSHLCLT
jgi:uncharacterized protein